MKEEWKVYIGGIERSDEIIKALTDLGAKNNDGLIDKYISCHYIYFINHKGNISSVSIKSETAKIIMDNYREIKLVKNRWKEGDILINNDGTCYKVFSEYDTNIITNFFGHNIQISVNGINAEYDGTWVCEIKDYRLATPKEIEHFHEILHKCGKDWDAEKKSL